MVAVEIQLVDVDARVTAPNSLIQAVETLMLKLVAQLSSPLNGLESLAQQAATYHLTSGGQRIRAQLAIHASLALKLPVADAVAIAVAVELIHNASLVHDDLQDRDLVRHGVATVWSAFGDGVAICAGDLLLSAAYCALAGISRPHLLPVLIPMLHKRVGDASAGQCVDLTSQKATLLSFKTYETLAVLKSGALLALPLELALATAGELQSIAMARQAAESFAIGYQIFDDLGDEQRDLMRSTAQPAVNAVAVIQAIHPGQDPRALARAFANARLDEAAELCLSLPQESGLLLRQLARDLRGRILAGCA
jgi:geranylgeranyl pyrophosphate synthase